MTGVEYIDRIDSIERAQLESALKEVHTAGMPGAFAEVCDSGRRWRGEVGVADLATGRTITADMHHRVGSITKTFTAAAILQLVERGDIHLDVPIRQYLPFIVRAGRGRAITVRSLLNHTSGLADYLPTAYPSMAAYPAVADTTPESLDDNRFVTHDPLELIEMGVRLPTVTTPGCLPGVYSDTNYLILGQLLELVTGTSAEDWITRSVIERAGLRDTYFPSGPEIDGEHSKSYESWFGMLEPPRDFSVFDLTSVGPASSLVSTVGDLNQFFRLLMGGSIVGPRVLAQMTTTVPVLTREGATVEYGLGLQRRDIPGVGSFWGHDGSVWGAGTLSLTSADGARQMTIAINRQRWNTLDASGRPRPHPIDGALDQFHRVAMGATAGVSAARTDAVSAA